MAEVLGRSKLFSPCGYGSMVVSPKRRSPSLVGFSWSSTSYSSSSSRYSGFHGGRLVLGDRRRKPMKGNIRALPAKMSLCIGKASKWWEKGVQPNMKEIQSAEDLVNSLLDAGDSLVVVDFFSPGCGGCRALHPKICQIAEMNPHVLFLQVNYEEHKSMSYSLNVHVLPFFRFYRGAQGRLCSFSCTNATIKKFKDALAKHGTERCSLGPAKGLEESELMALSANKDLSFTYTRKPELIPSQDGVAEPKPILASPVLPPIPVPVVTQGSEDKSLVTAGR